VDVGSQKTSIACIDDGFLIPESRIQLKFGGDDLTRVLHYILQEKTLFPYRELNLARNYDFSTVESLKEHYCTLHEVFLVVLFE
jgi:actin-related protein 8